mmetsp:Transcript_4882/g.10746  ORF Transcript_4882/g.10746 Transcript_4882/m.10746 type:complete len:516 (+) Transcript_4882:50-1597(+)|eukprot:CAMPEP_0204273038 /NCGR_PEP_ID=MMETSP0468-20130131/22429_1 /ASSEMBLY_ACC=CAM_ASM_000383 /TAXON_ID=2969 /ORGANISM="Oxyrrhis marina" /LENGTH=515 /DNA_ID=CAMNT_0051248965 /DNA_START=45 /DNA_END=1592 /DNA_ORIENTATION=+
MKYSSTRGQVRDLGFVDAVLSGLADDGGLFVPDSVPQISPDEYRSWEQLAFPKLAFQIMRKYIDPAEIPDVDLHALVDKSYAPHLWGGPDCTPVKKSGRVHILELWHGPTLAFKDVALQFLGNLFDYVLEKRDRRMVIIGATSGDTGGAAIYGVRGKERVDCVILYPEGKTSKIQELQMATVEDANIQCIAVEGNFDDCQNIVKSCFNDADLKKSLGLGAVNSINWARILAQIVYYIDACYKVGATKEKPAVFSVPTGNFGDILAGYYAKAMGAPIGQLIIGSNSNDILPRFFNTGAYKCTSVASTMSPSMDIQISSNFERFLHDVFKRDASVTKKKMQDLKQFGVFEVSREQLRDCRKHFSAYGVDEEQTQRTIAQVWRETSELLCPHTAVGYNAAQQFLKTNTPSGPVVVLATAHFGKFVELMEPAFKASIEKDPSLAPIMKAMEDEMPQVLKNLRNKQLRKELMPASDAQIKRYLRRRFGRWTVKEAAPYAVVAAAVAAGAFLLWKRSAKSS